MLILKHRKYAKRIIKNFFLILIPFIFLGLLTTSTEKTTRADEEVVVVPKFTPSKDPEKFLGIWTSGGYDLQPAPDYHTTVNEPVTIRTNTRRSIWATIGGLLDSPHYRWWQSTDGKNWTSVSKNNNGQKKNFTVTPTKTGT